MNSGASAIDLRSDTVTTPTQAMREVMARAEVGDDVLGDEPTVIRLQEKAANLLGKADSVYVPSGTMANLCGICSQTRHGEEIIAHNESHFYFYETGGFAAVAGCSVRFVPGRRGIFGPDVVEANVRPQQIHYPRTSLVIIENTHNRGGGAVWKVEQVKAVCDQAHEMGLRVHMDGARLLNACIAAGVDPTAYTKYVDTVSMCFSKGLGAPVGSVLAGDEETIQTAHHFRKMLGGTMRQSGVIASAAIYALDHHVTRLADDHANAKAFAQLIAQVPGITLDVSEVETNMVFFDVDPKWGPAKKFVRRLEKEGVRMFATGPQRLRAVFHLEVSAEQAKRAAEIIAGALQQTPA